MPPFLLFPSLYTGCLSTAAILVNTGLGQTVSYAGLYTHGLRELASSMIVSEIPLCYFEYKQKYGRMPTVGRARYCSGSRLPLLWLPC